jgi:transaldolase
MANRRRHERYAATSRSGPEPLARQHYAHAVDSGTLSRYIREFALTGLTSNPTIFDQAVKSTGCYDEAFAKSWSELMYRIASKSEALMQANRT